MRKKSKALKIKNKSIIAFDVGASKIACGIIQLKVQSSKLKTITQKSKIQNFDFKIYNFNKIKTPKSKKEVIEKIIEIVTPILSPPLANKGRKNAYGKIVGVGIGMAGRMDFKNGIVSSSLVANGWKNVPLKKILEKKLGLPVALENDARCFILGELKFGKAKNYKHIIGLTLGTKIGSGIIIDGKLYYGANNAAGEFGYTIKANKNFNISIKDLKKDLKKSCDKKDYHYLGEWAAGRGMERLYKKLTGENLTAFEIKKRALKKEKTALKIINLSAESLGIEIANIINFLNPEIIVIGGGLSRMDILWKPMVQEAKKRVFFAALKKTKIIRSQLLEKANLLGAASLFLKS
jgi:glucokinase